MNKTRRISSLLWNFASACAVVGALSAVQPCNAQTTVPFECLDDNGPDASSTAVAVGFPLNGNAIQTQVADTASECDLAGCEMDIGTPRRYSNVSFWINNVTQMDLAEHGPFIFVHTTEQLPGGGTVNRNYFQALVNGVQVGSQGGGYKVWRMDNFFVEGNVDPVPPPGPIPVNHLVNGVTILAAGNDYGSGGTTFNQTMGKIQFFKTALPVQLVAAEQCTGSGTTPCVSIALVSTASTDKSSGKIKGSHFLTKQEVLRARTLLRAGYGKPPKK